MAYKPNATPKEIEAWQSQYPSDIDRQLYDATPRVSRRGRKRNDKQIMTSVQKTRQRYNPEVVKYAMSEGRRLHADKKNYLHHSDLKKLTTALADARAKEKEAIDRYGYVPKSVRAAMRQPHLDEIQARMNQAVIAARKRHDFKSKDKGLQDTANEFGVPYSVVRKAYDDPYYVPDVRKENYLPTHNLSLGAVDDLVLPNIQRKVAHKRDAEKFNRQLQDDIAAGRTIGMDYIDRFVNENATPEKRAAMKDQLAKTFGISGATRGKDLVRAIFKSAKHGKRDVTPEEIKQITRAMDDGTLSAADQAEMDRYQNRYGIVQELNDKGKRKVKYIQPREVARRKLQAIIKTAEKEGWSEEQTEAAVQKYLPRMTESEYEVIAKNPGVHGLEGLKKDESGQYIYKAKEYNPDTLRARKEEAERNAKEERKRLAQEEENRRKEERKAQLEKERLEHEAEEKRKQEEYDRQMAQKREQLRLQDEERARAQQEANARAQAEKDRLAREAQAKAQADANARAQAEKDRLAREASAKAQADANARAQAEKDRLAREASAKAQADANARAQAEKDRLAREAQMAEQQRMAQEPPKPTQEAPKGAIGNIPDLAPQTPPQNASMTPPPPPQDAPVPPPVPNEASSQVVDPDSIEARLRGMTDEDRKKYEDFKRNPTINVEGIGASHDPLKKLAHKYAKDNVKNSAIANRLRDISRLRHENRTLGRHEDFGVTDFPRERLGRWGGKSTEIMNTPDLAQPDMIPQALRGDDPNRPISKFSRERWGIK